MFDLLKIFGYAFTSNRNVDSEELTPLLADYGRQTEDGYMAIGRVAQFVIYPIDCGLGFKFQKAIFTANGIQMIGSEKYMVDDRTLIVYNKSTMEALVDPKFTITAKKEEILLYCLGELFKQQYEKLEVIHVNYQGTELPLRIFPIESTFEKEIQKKIFKAHKKGLLGLGYCTNENRRLLNEKHRFRPSESNNLSDDEMKMAFLPNFSNYTLINTKSYVRILNERIKKDTSLNFRNFRPQIVVKFEKVFEEDNIEEIKIGPYIFNRVIPCVTEATNYNLKCTKKNFSQVYQRLQSERTLFNIYPRFAKAKNPILPIFGLNMELKQEPKAIAPLNAVIQRGAIVSVKYFKSASLHSPTFASTSKCAPSPISQSVSIPISKSVPSSISKLDSIPDPKPVSTSISTTFTTTVSISAPPAGITDEVSSDLASASISTSTANCPTNTVPDSENSPLSNSDEAFAVEPESNLPSESTSTHTINYPINTAIESESNSADVSTIESAPDSAYASVSISATSSDVEPTTSMGKK